MLIDQSFVGMGIKEPICIFCEAPAFLSNPKSITTKYKCNYCQDEFAVNIDFSYSRYSSFVNMIRQEPLYDLYAIEISNEKWQYITYWNMFDYENYLINLATSQANHLPFRYILEPSDFDRIENILLLL